MVGCDLMLICTTGHILELHGKYQYNVGTLLNLKHHLV